MPSDKIMSLINLIHPLHTNLADPSQRPVHMIREIITDPWISDLFSGHTPHVRSRLAPDPHDSDISFHHAQDEVLTPPSFDVRESDTYYFLEGEFPGLATKRDILIEWSGTRMLIVEATIQKTDVVAEWGLDGSSTDRVGAGAVVAAPPLETEIPEAHVGLRHDGEELHGRPARHGRQARLKTLLNERHTGALYRSFTFPKEVNMDGLKARLSHGLLKILVPKAHVDEKSPKEERRRVHIED
ncbi:HSP20-like chaperone [Trichodelitschia bisporula]|uniref:HSP20-like chaperone n=1 Tax=Trichodelitschia bisporula TaxID=703511 RepID=A0A6G1HZ71_9PEZI|nr:HSP20-like chaperone [Trichodelitschia bisporula]